MNDVKKTKLPSTKADAARSRRLAKLEQTDACSAPANSKIDPFVAFSEWHSEEDRRAYARLGQQEAASC